MFGCLVVEKTMNMSEKRDCHNICQNEQKRLCITCTHTTYTYVTVTQKSARAITRARASYHRYFVIRIFSTFIMSVYIVSFLCQLVVHVGVSGMATTVTLEKCGRNHGYKGLDNSSFCPDSQCCIVGGPDCIDSVIDMESVCKRVTASGLGVAVSVSRDAGR